MNLETRYLWFTRKLSSFHGEPHMRKSGLPLVVDENTEILILGTLPSDTSLAEEQYYANPRNDFWKLVGAALEKSLDGLSYEDKLELLKANRIGLWDAFHTCFRPGSMDADITETELNDFVVLKSIAPSIRLICFNGKGAAEAEESLTRLDTKHAFAVIQRSEPEDQEGRLACWKSAIAPRTEFAQQPHARAHSASINEEGTTMSKLQTLLGEKGLVL